MFFMAKYCLLRNKNKIIAILKLLLFYASFSLAFSAFAQKNNLELDLITITKTKSQKPIYSGWVKFYKNYISSQDGEVCMFYPSCSNFAQNSIKKHGIFLGIFLATDRLLRCNGRPGSYHINHNEHYIDLP